ncbi:MAG TPA: type 4a pilus biogenesis protein PilO [Burkholderiales bacterium]|jgi:type IV pilus assembly protein PilO|nr:type 4a pilus biogenesis protein PilO [Burkholderiales bacterium]
MAATGAMADFGRMPTSRKVLIFVVIGLILGLLYWRFLFKPLQERVTRVEGEHKQLIDLNKQLEGDIPKYAVLRQQMAELQKTIEENQKALPTDAEIPHFFETLERKMNESGVEITKWKKGTEEPVETFVKVPVDIELVGTFNQLKRFFASLVQSKDKPTVDEQGVEERERIVSIENLVLAQPVVRNREIVLSAKFTAVTFRQTDAKALPPPEPTKAGKPLPPANTPAGAKAHVEDSMQKSEDRGSAALDKAGAGEQKLKEGN